MQARRERGFTLLEVLVAFMLASLLLSVILSSFAGGVASLNRTERFVQAALLAQSRMTELKARERLVQGRFEGEAEDDVIGFRWRADIEPFGWAHADVLRNKGMQILKVDVEVFWPSASGKEHSYRLSTLRTVVVESGQ